jgi:hypothetical protein
VGEAWGRAGTETMAVKHAEGVTPAPSQAKLVRAMRLRVRAGADMVRLHAH